MPGEHAQGRGHELLAAVRTMGRPAVAARVARTGVACPAGSACLDASKSNCYFKLHKPSPAVLASAAISRWRYLIYEISWEA